jgi:hypothetical protein
MKVVGKILSYLWVIAFGTFFILNFVPSDQLPEIAIEYRSQFWALLESFLSSSWFFVFFIFMWVFVAFQLAKDSGWKMLAEKYSLHYIEPTFSKFSTGSGYIGKTSHNGILKICVDNSGLYLKTMFPFNFGHKPMLIPWSDVAELTDEKALVPEKTPKLLRVIAEKITRKVYKRVVLDTFPDQKIIVHWEDRFNESIPSNLQKI